METDKKQFEMFGAGKTRPRKKKVMTAEHKALVAMYNATPTLVTRRPPKSMQKGASDLPLFKLQNQRNLF
jgi:hypothetical protein